METMIGQCACMGPQDGAPYCPCQMRTMGVIQKNGRYIQPEKDLGPVVQPINRDWIYPDTYEPQPCLHDQHEPGTIVGVSCPCPKCTPRC